MFVYKVIGVVLLLTTFSSVSDAEDDPELDTNVQELDESHLVIDGTTVTLRCPGGAGSMWYKNDKIVNTDAVNETYTLTDYSEKNDGLYKCSANKKDYYFYTKLKVCKGCVELDASLAMGIIVGDIALTIIVAAGVYLCAKKKSPSSPPQRATHGRQTSAPQPPEPDYQPLNPNTRSNDVYARANRK
ncbi:T-cell surface glycoprotein CD3 epsilon chain-like [Hoplias malabaricus]|uniref:T-cell surface glycoprotein CD3 epsilon chain-like n=1 Tax=Hoplias malabaricus TaxID=27720 RepID=UPI003462BDB0